MKHIVELAQEIKERDLRVTVTSAGVEQIHQTERNALKAELLSALCLDFADSFEVVGRSAEGILIEVPCDAVADGIANETGSGAITIAVDIKIKSLDTDIGAELEAYAVELEEKAKAEALKAEKKAKKIERDKALRAKKNSAQ
jgi:hypothetical protein